MPLTSSLPAGKLEARTDAVEIVVARRLISIQRCTLVGTDIIGRRGVGRAKEHIEPRGSYRQVAVLPNLAAWRGGAAWVRDAAVERNRFVYSARKYAFAEGDGKTRYDSRSGGRLRASETARGPSPAEACVVPGEDA